jgi:hypothetical protein
VGQEGTEWRDDGAAERRRWIGRPARCSSGVSVCGWRRTGQRALVRCSGASGARDCGCGAAEMADDGEQSRWRWSGGGAVRRRSRGAKMRVCESVNEVEEGSWMCCGNKKGHGQAGAAAGDWRRDVAALGDGGTTWRGGEKPAGSGERRPGELEGQVVGLERRGAGGSMGAHRQGAAGGGAEQQRNREGGERGRR